MINPLQYNYIYGYLYAELAMYTIVHSIYLVMVWHLNNF